MDAFEREHPGIKLQAAQGLSIAGPQAESSLLLAFAGGTAPDVVYVNFRTSAQYIAQGFLQPLDPYIARDPDTVARLNPVVRRVLHDVGGKHIYSLPYAQYVLALYYRKDLFQAAGLDPEQPPRNWDEFYRDAQAITDQPHGVWGFEFKSGPEASAVWWIDFLWQAGGDVVRRNKEGRWEAAFATPQGVKALEFYRKLKTGQWKGKDGHTYTGVATNAANADQDRIQGKCGMWFQYQSSVVANQADTSSINPSLIGIAPLPAGPTGIHANELNAAMWGMSSQIKSPPCARRHGSLSASWAVTRPTVSARRRMWRRVWAARSTRRASCATVTGTLRPVPRGHGLRPTGHSFRRATRNRMRRT